MPTHYLSSSNPINIYVTDSIYYTNIPNDTVVTVLDEGVGPNCIYHLVRIDDPSLIRYYNNEYSVATGSVYRLTDTAESAPRACVPHSEYDDSYEPPEAWYNVVDVPLLNKKDQQYYITVISNQKTLNQIQQLKSDAIEKGTKKILDYYFKDNSNQQVSKLLKYYKFANFVQYYVPFEPNLRIKCQISIPRKYIDAIQDRDVDTSTSLSTIGYYLKDVATKIDKASALLEQYHKDVVFYRANLKNINLSNDAKSLRSFREILQSYFALNNIKTLNKRGFVEFSIDNCFNIKNASYCDERSCKYVKIGLSQLIKTAPFNNPSVVNLISQLDIISQIRYCDTPWYDFLNMFYYPQQNIAPMQNPLDKFNNMLSGKYGSAIKIPSDINDSNELTIQINAIQGLSYSPSQSDKDLTFEDQLSQAYRDLLLNFRQNLVVVAGSKVLTGDGIQKYLSNFNSDNIIDKLSEIKLCELSSQAMECLGQLVSITTIEETHISFTYQEQKYELIPFLTVDEKKILFRKILNDRAINRQTINRLISKFETDVTRLHIIRKQPYDELVETLINYMVS
jgi:hypothetical protein